MTYFFDTILGLTTNAPTIVDRSTLVQRFAHELGWTPSYNLEAIYENDIVNIHLVVEHGLENSAILSFLKVPYNNLNELQRRSLLNISYNNLVDWHIHIDKQNATFIYNRLSPSKNIIQELSFRNGEYEALRSDAFEKLIGKKLSPNIPSLDDALINTISHWKKTLSAELNNKVSNESLSALFNAIIFIRALEDNDKRYKGINLNSKVLFEAWEQYKGEQNFTGIILTAARILNKLSIPEYLLDIKKLEEFDILNRQTLAYLINDFYHNRVANFYNYDFSIMSKHALSRIYEKYTALLKIEENSQLSFFPSLPQEETNKAFGAFYTPQYVARFFSKYLKQNLPPAFFGKIKIAEPSVGSGIFLRSLLELKCDPRIEENTVTKIKDAFQEILGVDVDGNACQAARLSLALLQLVLTDEFPSQLNIIQNETIEYFTSNSTLKESFDVVISNPPFIAIELLSETFKNAIKTYLGAQYTGRTDAYLAFLKLGVELLKPGGYGLFVLPHSFLISESAHRLRKFITEECWVHCLADLSAIPVFENTGIYVVLFIFQKKQAQNVINPQATIIKCREFVGKALQDGIRNNFVDNDFYSVFRIEQMFFSNYTWIILPLKELKLKEKLSSFPILKEFLEIRQGFVTGADDVFIIDKNEIPEGEETIYIPYLPDKQIDRYSIPKTAAKYLFFPFKNEVKIEKADLVKRFPKTWKYLCKHEDYLKSKKSFSNVEDWWRPRRTRQPEHLLSPKIVTPHLTILPKFAIDISGKFAVSRSPFFISKKQTSAETDLLLYFLAVLNSSPCFWYMSNHSHKYSNGYTMLEVKTLEETPVPDPSLIPVTELRKIIELVNLRLKKNTLEGILIDRQIDKIVCGLYNLSSSEQEMLGITL